MQIADIICDCPKETLRVKPGKVVAVVTMDGKEVKRLCPFKKHLRNKNESFCTQVCHRYVYQIKHMLLTNICHTVQSTLTLFKLLCFTLQWGCLFFCFFPRTIRPEHA